MTGVAMTAARRLAVSTHPAAVVLTLSWVPMVSTMGTTIVCQNGQSHDDETESGQQYAAGGHDRTTSLRID